MRRLESNLYGSGRWYQPDQAGAAAGIHWNVHDPFRDWHEPINLAAAATHPGAPR